MPRKLTLTQELAKLKKAHECLVAERDLYQNKYVETLQDLEYFRKLSPKKTYKITFKDKKDYSILQSTTLLCVLIDAYTPHEALDEMEKIHPGVCVVDMEIIQ